MVQDDGLTAYVGSFYRTRDFNAQSLVLLICARAFCRIIQLQILMPPSHPKTFLFDIGRVLLDFDFHSSLIRLIPDHIHQPLQLIDKVLERKDALETGSVDPARYASWALNILKSDATEEQFYHAWRHIFTPNEPMWNRVRQLERHHQLLLISNINAIHCPWIFTAYPEFGYFKHSVLSYQVGILKPELGIYQHAINTFQLDPSITFYIDDQLQNIEVGRKFGFQCWHYKLANHRAFEQWLDQVLAET